MKKGRKPWEIGSDSPPRPYIQEVCIMDNIVNVISSVGFPIAMCLLLFWYMQKESENHKSETNSLKEAINELRIAITTLVNKLDEK